MNKHSSNLFEFDKSLTAKGYSKYKYVLGLKHSEWNRCMEIMKFVFRQEELSLGIDLNKPWEEIDMEGFFQFEYLFVGKLLLPTSAYIANDKAGLNVYDEKQFGKKEFQTKDLLNLTVIIEKTSANKNYSA